MPAQKNPRARHCKNRLCLAPPDRRITLTRRISLPEILVARRAVREERDRRFRDALQQETAAGRVVVRMRRQHQRAAEQGRQRIRLSSHRFLDANCCRCAAL
jgi:hypothetical protein